MLAIHLILLLVLMTETTGQAVPFKDIQQEYFRKKEKWLKQRREQPSVSSDVVGPEVVGNGNNNGNCIGNCYDNDSGNENGNHNAGSVNGNNNGNCHGNCVGNENGNHNGNYNGGKIRRSNFNGNNNGNCFGNCYHNKMGNFNGNDNKWFQNNGNNLGNCKGNCFHYQRGNHFGNGDHAPPRHMKPTSCVGNCFPKEQPKVYDYRVMSYRDVVNTDLICDGDDGYTYYVKPESYCFIIHRHRTVIPSKPARTQCAEGEAFDLDICACNNWWFVDVEDSCTSGAGKF